MEHLFSELGHSSLGSAFFSYMEYSTLVAFAICLLLLLGARFPLALPLPRVFPRTKFTTFLEFGLPGGVLLLAVLNFALYLSIPSFRDYGEPVIPILATNLLNGATVYGSPFDGEEIVGSNYGPLIFLLQAAALLIHPSLWISKLTGIIFASSAIICIFLLAGDITASRRRALETTALFVALLSFNLHYWFWNRPDSALIALVALATIAHNRLTPSKSLMMVGLLAGLSINLKLFAAIYFLPFAAASASRLTLSQFVRAATIGGLLFFVVLIFPFLLYGFRYTSYIENILVMRKQGLAFTDMFPALSYAALILLIPLNSYMRRQAFFENKILMRTMIFSTILIAVAAGKPGGGAIYMMPFVPMAIYLALRFGQSPVEGKPIAESDEVRLLICVLLCAFPCWAYSCYEMSTQLGPGKEEFAKRSELRDLFSQFPTAEMGHGSGPRESADEYYRVQRAFLGQSTLFDYVNYADQRRAGIGIERVRHLFRQCKVPVWIFAKSSGRFTGQGYGVELFDDEIRTVFAEKYELTQTKKFYEVWTCKKGSTATSTGKGQL